MSDGATIAMVLASLKTAADIANLLRSTDFSLEKAELKLKVADLIGALADARMQMADLVESTARQERRIAELEAAFQIKGDIVLDQDAYYLKDGDRRVDGPFCTRCWEVEHRTHHLVWAGVGSTVVCRACDSHYDRRRVPSVSPPT